MAERIRFHPDVALTAFSRVIPMPTLAEINAAIDRSFGDQPERAEPLAMAELLRSNEAFRKLEETVCAEARAMATTLLKKIAASGGISRDSVRQHFNAQREPLPPLRFAFADATGFRYSSPPIAFATAICWCITRHAWRYPR